MQDEHKLAAIPVVLASNRPDDHDSLEALLSGSPWQLLCVGSGREAAYLLHQVSVPIALCDLDLDDEPWQDTIRGLIKARRRACVVILASAAYSGVSSEVIGRGGFDLLTRPFERGQIFGTLFSAYAQYRVNWPLQVRRRPVPVTSTSSQGL